MCAAVLSLKAAWIPASVALYFLSSFSRCGEDLGRGSQLWISKSFESLSVIQVSIRQIIYLMVWVYNIKEKTTFVNTPKRFKNLHLLEEKVNSSNSRMIQVQGLHCPGPEVQSA